MAPIVLEPHSCRHCQTFVIDDVTHAQERLYRIFQYTITEVLTAASENCAFCTWLLDNEEWIHYSAITGPVLSGTMFAEQTLTDALAWLSFQLDNDLPKPNPANTLHSVQYAQKSAINGPVDFPARLNYDENELPVIGIDIALADPGNPCGSLLEGSGRLTLKTRTLMVILSFENDQAFGMQVSAKGVMVARDFATFTVQVSYDAIDGTEEERDENNAVLIKLSGKCSEQSWSCRGLVGRHVSRDTYRRVSTFHFESKDDTGRRNDESLEIWQQRVYREFSVFSDERPTVIDIII